MYTLGNLAVERKAVKQLLPQGIIPALASSIRVSGKGHLSSGVENSTFVQTVASSEDALAHESILIDRVPLPYHMSDSDRESTLLLSGAGCSSR